MLPACALPSGVCVWCVRVVCACGVCVWCVRVGQEGGGGIYDVEIDIDQYMYVCEFLCVRACMSVCVCVYWICI